MAQNTRCDVRKCLFAVHTMADNILGFKFPKNRQKWRSISRAVRRRRRTAAADRNWSARRRRRRPNVGVAPAPFSWRVYVMLYTSYMLLDFCNAVHNKAWTLTKISKNDAGAFCNSPWYSNETRQSQSKSVFVDNFVKIISHAKSLIWNFFGNLVNKANGKVKDFNSVYCNNCL